MASGLNLPDGCTSADIDRAMSGRWCHEVIERADEMIMRDLRQALLMIVLMSRAANLLKRARAVQFETVLPYDSESLDAVIVDLDAARPVTDLAWEAMAIEIALAKAEENRE